VRPGLLLFVFLLFGAAVGVAAQETRDDGVALVKASGVSGTLGAALDEALARFRLFPEADEADEERELRRAERAATEFLATEGYFSPRIRFEPNPAGTPRYRLVVELGRRTRVSAVTIEFTGDLAEPAFAERATALRKAWALPVGAPFRSPDWEIAKSRLLQAATAHDFAAATLAQSSAEVDAEAATAVLRIELDSGPAYRVGALRVEGTERFDQALVERFNPFRPGQAYDRALVLQFQQALQESAYFSSVVVTLDLDHAVGDTAPLRVQVRESLTRRLAAGVGFATNTGAHIEAIYRQSITFGLPYLLQTGFRVDQTGQYAYADLVFPPQPGGARFSVGVLVENSDIENLQIYRWGLGAARSKLIGPRDGRNVETQLAVNFEHEQRETPLDPPITLNVLSTTYTWIRRDVDDITNPRRGNLLQLQGSAGLGGLSVSDTFLRGFGSIVQYLPVGLHDVVILRGQLGAVEAESTNNVPNNFLFRTGGALTVRGYDYESLGVDQGGAVVGGRALVVGSVEYVHWPVRWGGNWGIAAFLDAGDAQARFSDLDIALGYGLGLRWRTPAGPLAIDLAWGDQSKRLHLHFSVAIAF